MINLSIVDIQSDDLKLNDNQKKEFIITIYGIDESNNRVITHVTGYYPYFYLKIPNHWERKNGERLIKDICDKSFKSLKKKTKFSYNTFENVKQCEIQISKELYGLQWNHNTNNVQSFNFLKITLYSHQSMKKLITEIKKYYHSNDNTILYKEWLESSESSVADCNLYESSIHPVIRFIHDTKINPTGWISFQTIEAQFNTGIFSCENEYTTTYKNIIPIDNDKPISYRVASFDIECDSLHGDFPMAYKNFKKFSGEIFESYQNIIKNTNTLVSSTIKSNCKGYIAKLIQYGFNDVPLLSTIQNYVNIHKLQIKNNEEPSEETFLDISNIICDKLSDNLNNLEITSKDRESTINDINDIINDYYTKLNISVEGDPIIQIGTVFYDFVTGDIFRHILVIPHNNETKICDKIENITVEECKDEKELLIGWTNIINKMDPDFITGYNIFGFDFKYIHDRAEILFPCNCKNKKYYHDKKCNYNEFMNFGKINMTSFGASSHQNKSCKMNTQRLSSSALGDNTLNYISMDGRILFDIQKEIQKGHNLESYKLDNVASHFMRGKLLNINMNNILVSDIGQLKNGDFISFRTHTNIGEELFNDGKKYKIDTINDKNLILTENLDMNLENYHKVEWCLNKDDISPQDIFDKHKYGGSSGRAEIAKYCIQDCELCINLLLLLDIVPNNLGMASVSYVPASFIFVRGQGVKITSVVSRKCNIRNTRIPELKKLKDIKKQIKMYKNGKSKEEIIDSLDYDENNNPLPNYHKPKKWEYEEHYKKIREQGENGIDGYEGAIVLEPKPGIYLDDPIAVLDYASLYPSSIIENNISHETLIEDKSLLPIIGKDNYYTIEYQDWIYRNKGKGDTIEKIKTDTKTICHFLKPEFMKSKNMFQKDENPIGIIPDVLHELLLERKKTKKLMAKEKNEFKKKVLDGLQLAYKVTANSVYGQLGAKTSTVFKMVLAACTTSVGRSRIEDASYGVKIWAEEKGYHAPEIIYGDTDSVFVKFSRVVNGKTLEGKEALEHCIQCGKEAGDYITKGLLLNKDEDDEIEEEYQEPLLNHPQELEYEKTFWPFILISKKRYTGDKYEFDSIKCSRNAMGIVLKRRDNAPIVKYVFGNVIEKIMIEKDFDLAVQWLKETLQKIRNKEFHLRYFIITKSLRGYYKNPKQIAHKVLADRMAERDPGNKPKSNDRIPYAYIKLPDEKLYDYNNPYKSGSRKGQPREINVMQGDRIEHYDYIIQNNLSLDYEFYITNQIMNPVKQVLDLRMDPNETSKLFSK